MCECVLKGKYTHTRTQCYRTAPLCSCIPSSSYLGIIVLRVVFHTRRVNHSFSLIPHECVRARACVVATAPSMMSHARTTLLVRVLPRSCGTEVCFNTTDALHHYGRVTSVFDSCLGRTDGKYDGRSRRKKKWKTKITVRLRRAAVRREEEEQPRRRGWRLISIHTRAQLSSNRPAGVSDACERRRDNTGAERLRLFALLPCPKHSSPLDHILRCPRNNNRIICNRRD